MTKLTQSKHVKQKVLDIIDKFRSESNKLPSGKNLENMCSHSFVNPCQVYVISSPSNNEHLLIATQSKLISDKTFHYYLLKSKSYPEELEEIIHKTKWLITHHVITNEYIENLFLMFGQSISDNHAINRSEILPIIFSHYDKFTAFLITGNILEINYDEYLTKKIENYKELDKKITVKLPMIPDDIMNTGFLTVFDPPIIIGNLNFTLSQKIRSEEFSILNKNSIKINFQKNVITITKNGKIWIDNPDKKTSQKIFNTIMAVTLLFDIPAQTIRPSDLAEIKFDVKTRSISQYSWSPLNPINQYLDRNYRTAIINIMRKRISCKLLSNIIQIAESIIKKYEYTYYLELILHAYTQLNNEDTSQSFITSWTIIENDLYKKWSEKINLSDVNDNVKKKLNNLPVDKILDYLYMDAIIPNDNYIHIKSLQQTRNKIIHRGYVITSNDAKICYDTAWNIINTIVKDIVNLSGIHA